MISFMRLTTSGEMNLIVTHITSSLKLIATLSGSETRHSVTCTRVYRKVSGLAAWGENHEWYNSLPLGAVVSLFCEVCRHISLCRFSTSVYCLFRYRPSPETFGYILVRIHRVHLLFCSIVATLSHKIQ
jgi:hypothetical protein